MIQHSQFMGYGTALKLLSGVTTDTTLYFSTYVIEAPTKYSNFVNCKWYAVLCFIDSTGVCHYCRMPFGALQLVKDYQGEPVGDCKNAIDRIEERKESLVTATREWLRRAGFMQPRQAIPALPKEFVLLDGHFTFLHYNGDSNSYELSAPHHPEGSMA